MAVVPEGMLGWDSQKTGHSGGSGGRPRPRVPYVPGDDQLGGRRDAVACGYRTSDVEGQRGRGGRRSSKWGQVDTTFQVSRRSPLLGSHRAALIGVAASRR